MGVFVIEISVLKEKVLCNAVEITHHVWMRSQQRKISYREIKETILNGDIIEEYPDDYPYPSCLICGSTTEGRILHTVVGLSETTLWIVTVYEPDAEQWSADFKIRRR